MKRICKVKKFAGTGLFLLALAGAIFGSANLVPKPAYADIGPGPDITGPLHQTPTATSTPIGGQ